MEPLKNSSQENQTNPAFGLATDEILTSEGIIRAAFVNPDREKYDQAPEEAVYYGHNLCKKWEDAN